MPVNKDSSGRRSVQVEVEVSATPEQAWEAVATAAGISSWFVPTTSENDENGVPVKIINSFGPGMDSVSTVTDWNPPHSLSAESHDFGPDGPPIATEWIVEAREGGTCIVRVVHSLFASTDDWDKQMEGWESGWPAFFRLLRLYLAHFTGEPCAAFQLMGFSSSPPDATWRTLCDGLGLEAVAVGERVESSGAAPRMAGTVECVGEGGGAHAEELMLRLDDPAPGIAHLFAMKMGGQVVVSIRFYLYGSAAAAAVARDESSWQAWIGETFPMEVPTET
ncbi:MAG: SRPBCC family protein [Planctomycetota bacterium]|jgi:uncharacterized protein YndB with AHSA1/START domain